MTESTYIEAVKEIKSADEAVSAQSGQDTDWAEIGEPLRRTRMRCRAQIDIVETEMVGKENAI